MEVTKLLDLKTNLEHIETVTKKKSRKHRALATMNGLLIVLEFSLLIILFTEIFQWHINTELSSNYVWLLCFMLGIYGVQILSRGLLKLTSPYSWLSELYHVIKISFITFMLTAGALFMMKISNDYSRLVIGLFFSGMVLSTWMIRLIKRSILYILTSNHVLTKNVIIVGAGKVGRSLYSYLTSSKSKGYQVIGFVDDNKKDIGVKGNLSDIEAIIEKYEVDEVIVTIPSERTYIYSLLKKIQKHKVNIKIIPELYNLVSTKVGLDQISLYPFVEVKSIRMDGWHGLMKRIVDITLSSIGMLSLLPVFISLWCAVKINSPGPAIFKQTRIGRNGQKFYIYKFRSMVIDAEKKLKENPELYKLYIESNYKLEPEQDPRITKLGRFLRRTSLDELPQLFNVLKGDMSLVGPRPVIHEELQEYEQLIFDFLSVKPGITGYWQVSGRSDAGYPERVDIELYYVYNQSLALDFKIMVKTISTVLKREGAY